MKNINEKIIRETVAETVKRGMSALSIVHNNKCNLACKHCYIQMPERRTGKPSSFYRAIPPELFDNDTAVKVAKDAKGLVYLITIPAMEPFLDAKVRDRTLDVAKVVSDRASVSVITNGTTAPYLFDEQKVKELAKHVEFLSVSLEGNQIHHDLIRGEGNFQRTIGGIRHLIKMGYPGGNITLQTCVQPSIQDSYSQAKESLELADRLNVGKISFTNFVDPRLSKNPNREDVEMHKESFNNILRALSEMEKQNIQDKIISIYETYESPAGLIGLKEVVSEQGIDFRDSEFNAFETSYFYRHPKFKKLDLRLELAPASVEIPCYPRITAARFEKLINITDDEQPFHQGALITKCFSYQRDEPPMAHWIPGLFPFMEKALREKGERLARSLQIPPQDEIISVDPEVPRTKSEYFETVLIESVRHMLQSTSELQKIYQSLNCVK